MDKKVVKRAILIYTEQTPNPETIKYVTNSILYGKSADFKTQEMADEWSPLASHLYKMPYVKSVYICQNFVSITKEFNYPWEEIMLPLKEALKKYITEDGVIIKDGFGAYLDEQVDLETGSAVYSGKDQEIVTKIKELIEKYVKPAVEMDGGNIAFHAWDAGVVTVVMQGSCSGCPSSTVTLKSGIESMLSRMIPEVKEVVSIAG